MNIINIDASALVIIGIIILLVFSLNRLLFRPVNAILDARDRQVKGPHEEARKLLDDHDRQFAGLQASIADARRQANAYKAGVKVTARQEGDTVLAASASQAKQLLEQQTAEIEAQKNRARVELAGHVQGLAERISDRFVG